MIIRKYGIELRRVTAADIELIRQERNRDSVRQHMFHQEIITAEQQRQWFASIDNFHCYYFLICHQGKPLGLLQGKYVDYEARTNEGGIFLWQQDASSMGIATKASICFIDASFRLLRLNKVYAHVRPDNPAAYHYNLSLGYVPCPEKGDNYLVLTRAAYDSKIAKLRHIASAGKDLTPLEMSDIDIPDATAKRYLYDPLPADIFEQARVLFEQPNGWLTPRKVASCH